MICTKVAYTTRKEGHFALRKIERSGGRAMRCYYCPDCFRYHLTSQLEGYRNDKKPILRSTRKK